MGCAPAWVAPKSARHLTLPELFPALLGIPAIVPSQLLAAHLASNDGVNADHFRTDVPQFRKSLSQLKL